MVDLLPEQFGDAVEQAAKAKVAETVDDWSQGVRLAYLQELCRYRAGKYDFEAARARLARARLNASRSSERSWTGSEFTSSTSSPAIRRRCRSSSPTAGRARWSSSIRSSSPSPTQRPTVTTRLMPSMRCARLRFRDKPKEAGWASSGSRVPGTP
jgi:hypothetical protein